MHRPSLKRALATLAAVGLFGVSACDTAAVGVDACRQVEYARCSAASHCPATFHIPSPAACRRFYRDHCLHGLAVGADPGAPEVNKCTEKIGRLGDCARHSESALLSDCSGVKSLDSKITRVCALLQEPENIKDGCEFLNPNPPAPSLDAGQDSGI